MEKGQSIRTISHALQILKTINRLDAPTLTEISRSTSLPYPTTFRLVHALIEEGMVEQEPFRKRYVPTEQVRMLSTGFQEDTRLLNASIDPMKQFTQEFLWPVALTVRVGNRMMVKHSTSQLTTQTFQN
ncbi:MAG: helix-turn-helix domain-containing protein [Pseudomonadota bacterium]